MKSFRFLFYTVALFLAWGASSAQAAELSYDRYAAELSQTSSRSRGAKAATDFLTYPFELVRWPVNKTVYLAEKYRVLDKSKWIYETVSDYGVSPRLDGIDVDLIRLTQQKVNFPDTIFKTWMNFSPESYFETGAKIGQERLLETPFRISGTFDYADRPEEPFFGVGPDTSRGEGITYKHEETLLQAEFGYSPDPSFAADVFFAYKNVNITNRGDDRERPVIDTAHPGTRGLDGDELIVMGGKIERDTRNQKDNSTAGSLGRFAVSFNEGVDDSRARFFKYETEFAKYVTLGSPRRVLVGRFYGEHNDELDNHYIPFHQMGMLGGFGTRHGRSQTFRAYDRNRFVDESLALFNLEYRYTIAEYRDWKVDTVLFWDEGQVFGEFSEMQLHDFRESYGIGFRLSLLNNVLVSIEMAHGDEGTNLYVKSRSPF